MTEMTEQRRAPSPREVFERQIRLILADERAAQLALYADDCHWEFPFATGDRPRWLTGRAEIGRAMMPLWEKARAAGLRASFCDITAIHETRDPEVIVAEFTLGIEARAAGRTDRLDFVQVLRVRDGKIVELREYFDPLARARVSESAPR